MIRPLFSALLAIIFLPLNAAGRYDTLKSRLDDFIASKDANIGVAVIVDSRDTIEINGNRRFPMLSVYKLPIALAYIDKIRNVGTPFDHDIQFNANILNPDTYSPMMDIIPPNYMDMDSLRRSADELLSCMLKLSDNNASDIILSKAGGAGAVRSWLDRLGHKDIRVLSSEREMYGDHSLAYANSSTPVAMARLIDNFDTAPDDDYSLNIRKILENADTGQNRIAAGLGDGAVLGHKTGTGFSLPDGRIMSVNDAGYVRLPDGRRYSIAVFIVNSAYSMSDTEAIIEYISRLVYNHLTAI